MKSLNATATHYDYWMKQNSVVEGLELIISHLREPIWPRTISTKTTEGRQIPVYSKQEALAWYKAANFLDCRINAYPYYGKEIINNRQTVDLIIIDLDLAGFKSRRALDSALNKTRRKIKETFGPRYEPLSIWSGNGYHIYIPIYSRYVLEDIPEFKRFEKPSKQFLRFAEWYLSDGKCDPAHNKTVSFGNSMLRIPGSHNSKTVLRNHGISDSTTEVKIIGGRNGIPYQHVPELSLLLGSFYAYLVDQRLAEERENSSNGNNAFGNYTYSSKNNNVYYSYFEKLLQIPISDHRKFACYWLLSRYLINVKNMNPEEAYVIIKNWLLRCNEVERLLPSKRAFETKIKSDIKEAQKSGKVPIGEKILKDMNEKFYRILLALP